MAVTRMSLELTAYTSSVSNTIYTSEWVIGIAHTATWGHPTQDIWCQILIPLK